MECPVCREPMAVMEYRNIELDYCVSCLGVWFDEGEIELLIQEIGLDPAQHGLTLNSPAGVVTEARRRCPACHKLMDKVSPEGQPVVIDRCPHQHGIWFDAGEIRASLESITVPPDTGKTAMVALADFLGHALQGKNE